MCAITLALRFGSSPLLRCGRNQHEPRGRSSFAKRVEKLADGVRPIGVLRSVALVAVTLDYLYPRPVGIKFVCNNAWQAGADSVTHFGPMGDDQHGSIRLNPQKDAGVEGCRIDRRSDGARGHF